MAPTVPTTLWMNQASRNTDMSPLSDDKQWIMKSTKVKVLEETCTAPCRLTFFSKDCRNVRWRTESAQTKQWCVNDDVEAGVRGNTHTVYWAWVLFTACTKLYQQNINLTNHRKYIENTFTLQNKYIYSSTNLRYFTSVFLFSVYI